MPGFLPFIKGILQRAQKASASQAASSQNTIDRTRPAIWSAKLVEKGRPKGYRYFSTEALRDAFAEENKAKGWKKYGTIEPENLEKHLKSERNSEFLG
mgnify:FL=1